MWPHFDYTISLGSLATLATIIYAVGYFKASVHETLKALAKSVDGLAVRQTQHELEDDARFDKIHGKFDRAGERTDDLISGLQRLIGRSEVLFRREARPPRPREGE